MYFRVISRRNFSVRRKTLPVLQLITFCCIGSALYAQARPAAQSDPSAELASTLSAACKHDETNFASHLTNQTAAMFAKLPQSQRAMFMARLVLLNATGSALLSNGADGNTIVRCQAGGVVTEMRFKALEIQDNLAFIAVDAPAKDGSADRSVRFGLVREGGDWKLISVGLLFLDLPAMTQQWVEEDLLVSETKAVAALHEIAEALDVYRQGFDKLPDSLQQLGPAPPGDISPDKANLVDESLAGGEKDGYRFRYVIVPAPQATEESERDKAARFSLAATPLKYGQSGRRSFYLDSDGMLRGADKHGEVANSSDPRISEPRM